MAIQSTQFNEPGLPGIASAALYGGRFGEIGGTTNLNFGLAGASDSPDGIIGGDVASGDPASLHTKGRGVLTVNGLSTPIARGDRLKPTTGGIGIKASAGEVSGAIALEAATVDATNIRVIITGPIIATHPAATTDRDDLTQEDLSPYPIDLGALRVHDNYVANLGTTALSADDLIVSAGTYGTNAIALIATDFGGTNTTQYGRFRFTVPPEYVAGETLTLRINAGMVTTVADTSCTVDVQCFRAAAPTVDICATTAADINSLTAADKNFTLTPTNVVPGDILDFRITVAGVDAGNLGVMTPTINSITLLADIKG